MSKDSPNPHRLDGFTRQELLQLTRDIQHIEDENKLADIADLLKRYEPSIDDDKEEIEIDLTTLHNSTLVALRAKVDELMS